MGLTFSVIAHLNIMQFKTVVMKTVDICYILSMLNSLLKFFRLKKQKHFIIYSTCFLLVTYDCFGYFKRLEMVSVRSVNLQYLTFEL